MTEERDSDSDDDKKSYEQKQKEKKSSSEDRGRPKTVYPEGYTKPKVSSEKESYGVRGYPGFDEDEWHTEFTPYEHHVSPMV